MNHIYCGKWPTTFMNSWMSLTFSGCMWHYYNGACVCVTGGEALHFFNMNNVNPKLQHCHCLCSNLTSLFPDDKCWMLRVTHVSHTYEECAVTITGSKLLIQNSTSVMTSHVQIMCQSLSCGLIYKKWSCLIYELHKPPTSLSAH